MLTKQQEYSETSHFWPILALKMSNPDRHFMRVGVCRFAAGRYLQVIQVPTTFDRFPQMAFGSVRSLSEDAGRAISEYVSNFWQFLESQVDNRESTTVLLLSGWGTPHSVSPKIDVGKAPPNWNYLNLRFSDAAVLGACEHGKFHDISRILRQIDLLETEGFSFQNVNGILNLFGLWRSAGGNLIPENMREIEPPCNLIIPTDDLLQPRLEAARKRDVRALPLPDGTFKVVQRIEWDDIDDLQPIYAAIEDAGQGRLLGAVFINERTWWIDAVAQAEVSRARQYRIWHAMLQWLAVAAPNIIETIPQAFPPGAAKVEIRTPAGTKFEGVDPETLGKLDLPETITSSYERERDAARVEILPQWMAYLGKPENDAELELIAAILEQLADRQSQAVSRQELREGVRESVGSRDWRWLHARQIVTPLDRLVSGGLIDRFREITLSAMSLVKCGSVWRIRSRSDGLEINGEVKCRDFLTRYRDNILDELISDIRKFNRKELVILAAKHYQAARSEQSSWHGTIKALRAIHGTVADVKAFKRQNAINAVQRAAKSVCEIAACDAPKVGAANPGHIDLDEIFARALLLFGNGQILASILTGLIEPTLKISPAGDLLSDRSVSTTILKPGAEWSSTQALNEAADTYGRDRAKGADQATAEALPWDEALRNAVEAEYGVSAEAFFDLQYAVSQLAEERNEDVFLMKRSDLSGVLSTNKGYPSDDPSRFLDRLTLSRRASWTDRSAGLSASDIDLGRFDRPFSIINRPLIALDDDADPLLLVAPMFISDSTMYSLVGLKKGSLHNRFWISVEAKRYAGKRANAAGHEFENTVVEKLRCLGLEAWPRKKLGWALNEKVPSELGDIDVLAVSPDRKKVWVIEVKNLGLCRTETEVAARLSEYRGQMIRDRRGRQKRDKMLKHIQRVQYLRQRRDALIPKPTD